MKDYLPQPQPLENEHTVSCSHCKRLIRSGGIPLFNISDSANNKLIDCILGMIYKTLSERGHSSEEDRQKLFTEACERYQLSSKILLADCDWAGTPVHR